MKSRQFLEHHGLDRNPFADEDAQTDPVFKEHCVSVCFHPAWDKVYGDPNEPSTAIVFGRKGTGKTAMRLQIVRHLEQFNREHSEQRIFVVTYDNLNPFLDRFRITAGTRRMPIDVLLKQWQLRDHMDAILSIGVTQLIDFILGDHFNGNSISVGRLESLSRHLARDLLLLATYYDQSKADPVTTRWNQLRRKLRYRDLRSLLPISVGIGCSAAIIALVSLLLGQGHGNQMKGLWPWCLLLMFASWVWFGIRQLRTHWKSMGIRRSCRVLSQSVAAMRSRLLKVTSKELASQPIPGRTGSDDRYELLSKFQAVLESLGFQGIIVLVDRVDEPELINGAPERMKSVFWPILDNKLLKHPGLGIKLMLPAELKSFVDREDTAFYERSRLDKQNMIPSFHWSAESLLDLANSRIQACSQSKSSATLRDLLDDDISDERITQVLQKMRVPRNMFKYLYRLFIGHGNTYSEHHPVWRITSGTFEIELALYEREQDAFERGVGPG